MSVKSGASVAVQCKRYREFAIVRGDRVLQCEDGESILLVAYIFIGHSSSFSRFGIIGTEYEPYCVS